MFRLPSRIVVITSILFIFAAIAISTNLVSPSVLGLSAAANDNTINSEFHTPTPDPRVVRTPLNAITAFDAALIVRHGAQLPPPFNEDQSIVSMVADPTFPRSFDSLYVAKYVANLANSGSTGTTVPPGLLMGDVSGAGAHYDG